MLRILLVDDHVIVRRGLRQLLEEHLDWQVCGEAGTGRDAVQLCRELKPEVVIMDLSMPELNGLEAIKQIRAGGPTTEILVFTMHDTEKLFRQVLAAGARGYLLKSDSVPHIITAVEHLAQHKPFFTGKVSETILNTYVKNSAGGDLETQPGGLTPREREILQLLAEGKANKRVATLLQISAKTVETHRTNIMRKFGVNSIVELVRYALRNDLLRPEYRSGDDLPRANDEDSQADKR